MSFSLHMFQAFHRCRCY